jgi:hypothetical protein
MRLSRTGLWQIVLALPCPLALAAILLASARASAESSANRYFAIKVVDSQTGRGVPMVELKSVNNIRYYTDSNGLAAIDDPDLIGRKVFFYVASHGYEFPKDGFGFAGLALDVKPGGRAELKIKRLNIAERLYRITGGGVYRDSVLLGEPTPIREPLLNAQVTGQDGAVVAPYRGQIYWFRGDTGRLRHPLGQFAISGATSPLPGEGLDPAKGIDLTYFVDNEGFSRPMCPLPGPGVVWMDGLTVLADEQGAERMIAHYMRLKDLGLPL